MHQARVNNQAEDFVDGNPAGGNGFPAARLNPHIGLRASRVCARSPLWLYRSPRDPDEIRHIVREI